MELCYSALLGIVLVLSASAVDVTGTWKAVFIGPMGERPKMVSEMTFDLIAVDGKLIGVAHMGAWPGVAPLIDGKIEDDRIFFTAIGKSAWWSKSAMGTSSGLPKLTFTGRVQGDEMQLTLLWDSVMLYGPPPPGGANRMEMRARLNPQTDLAPEGAGLVRAEGGEARQ